MEINILFFSFLTFFLAGVYEALELRDGGSDYLGKGVSKVHSKHCKFM